MVGLHSGTTKGASLLVLLVISTLLGVPMVGAADAPFDVGPIVASLEPPITTYEVSAVDLSGNTLTFTWANSNKCGTFTWHSTDAVAVWYHGDDSNCSHSTTYHAGNITVSVTDGKGHIVSRSYGFGSLSGTSSGGPTNSTLCVPQVVKNATVPVSEGLCEDDMTVVDEPTESTNSTGTVLKTTFVNNSNKFMAANVWAEFYNAQGQTLGSSMWRLPNVLPGSRAAAYDVVPSSLGPGTYTVTIFATTPTGIPISPAITTTVTK